MGIVTRQLCKQFGTPPTLILKSIDLRIEDGEMIAITGKSGSGKSTLLYAISTLDPVSSGEVEIDGDLVSHMDSESVHRFRNQKMGFVFQFHYLLPELTAMENILMPAMRNSTSEEFLAPFRQHAIELLEQMDLKDKADRLPSRLSGGEQQRVAIARALIMRPKYIFADEPTGNLDSVSGNQVLEIFKKINRELGTTVIFVTHDREFAALARRSIVMRDGKIETL